MGEDGNTEGQENPTADNPTKPKEWVRLKDGDIPKVGENVKCQDGEGKVEWIKGPNLQVKLATETLWRGGIEMIRVLR